MIWPQSGSDTAVVSSLAQTIRDQSYRVTDLGDGTAVLQLDLAASWSTALQVLEVIAPVFLQRPPVPDSSGEWLS
jgi:hypothetical protein